MRVFWKVFENGINDVYVGAVSQAHGYSLHDEYIAQTFWRSFIGSETVILRILEVSNSMGNSTKLESNNESGTGVWEDLLDASYRNVLTILWNTDHSKGKIS